jgi:hypothetical protein
MQERTMTRLAGNPTAPDERERAVEMPTRHFANDDLTETESGMAAAGPIPSSHISELLSGHETKLAGVVPSHLRLRVQLGYIELDLTEATFEPGITNIEVHAFMGYVQVRFPPGVQVEGRGHALFGFFSFKNKHGRRAQDATDSQPVVRVTGRVTFGFAEGR